MANDTFIKNMPASVEAEQSVLGSIIINPQCMDDILSLVSIDDFYVKDHREIFAMITKLYAESKNIDHVILASMMQESGAYDLNQAKNYIKTLAQIVPTASNVRDYARIVHEKSLLRRLIGVCDEISEDAYAQAEAASTVIDSAESRIYALSNNREAKDFVHIRDVLLSTYAQIREAADNKGQPTGLNSGFSGLDRILLGMGKGDFVLIGARPGMGKTSFALNIAMNVARQTGKSVCIFSLEMSNEQLVQRILSSEALIESGTLRQGTLTKEDWEKLAQVSSFLSETEIYIDDTTNISASGMKAKLRRVKNLGLVVVDYLQLMQSDKKAENRVNEVSDISRNLKLLAKEFGVPVVCCTQLSRGAEKQKRDGGESHPMLSDLRDSGAIEQDADVIMFIDRDYYNDHPENENTAIIYVAKNRHGSTGQIKMGWYGRFTKFMTLEENREAP